MSAPPRPASLTRDHRRDLRVFLACSRELQAERDGFDSAVLRLAADAAFDRIGKPVPVRWETSAGGINVDSANRAIELSVAFPRLDVVVVVIGSRVGEWTKQEYVRALDLFRAHQRPRMLVYFRATEAGRSEPADVTAFREQVFADKAVAIPYASTSEWLNRLPVDILREFANRDANVPDVRRLRRRFISWTSANITLGALAVLVSTVMAFPTDGVTYARVLYLLLAPALLLLTTIGAVASYRRLMTAFRAIWRSPAYTDDAVWDGFAGVMPAAVTPRQTSSQFERTSPLMQIRVLLTLALAFGSGPIGAANAVFNEILVWEYVVGWDAGPPAASGFVPSTHVDDKRSRWPFELQSPAVRSFAQGHPDDQVHVHAHGQFCDPLAVQRMPLDRRFRCNQGPEVKLPLYLWLFVTAFVLASASALLPAYWLLCFRRSLGLLLSEVEQK